MRSGALIHVRHLYVRVRAPRSPLGPNDLGLARLQGGRRENPDRVPDCGALGQEELHAPRREGEPSIDLVAFPLLCEVQQALAALVAPSRPDEGRYLRCFTVYLNIH